MEIEGLQCLQFVDVLYSAQLDFLLCPPEIGILCQILGVNSHLNDFTILLQLSEDVDIDETSIVDESVILVLLFDLPISEQDPIFQNVLRWDLVVSFLNRSPVLFRQRVVSQVNHACRQLMCSPVLFFWLFMFS